jgi:hypothetical protein
MTVNLSSPFPFYNQYEMQSKTNASMPVRPAILREPVAIREPAERITSLVEMGIKEVSSETKKFDLYKAKAFAAANSRSAETLNSALELVQTMPAVTQKCDALAAIIRGFEGIGDLQQVRILYPQLVQDFKQVLDAKHPRFVQLARKLCELNMIRPACELANTLITEPVKDGPAAQYYGKQLLIFDIAQYYCETGETSQMLEWLEKLDGAEGKSSWIDLVKRLCIRGHIAGACDVLNYHTERNIDLGSKDIWKKLSQNDFKLISLLIFYGAVPPQDFIDKSPLSIKTHIQQSMDLLNGILQNMALEQITDIMESPDMRNLIASYRPITLDMLTYEQKAACLATYLAKAEPLWKK